METARFISAIVLLFAAVSVVVMNWGCVIVSFRNERREIDRHHSTVPLVSVILTVVAWLMIPWDGRHWLFIIPAADIGNLMVLWFPFWLMLGGPRRSTAADSTDPSDERPASSEDSEAENGFPS